MRLPELRFREGKREGVRRGEAGASVLAGLASGLGGQREGGQCCQPSVNLPVKTASKYTVI